MTEESSRHFLDGITLPDDPDENARYDYVCTHCGATMYVDNSLKNRCPSNGKIYKGLYMPSGWSFERRRTFDHSSLRAGDFICEHTLEQLRDRSS